MRTGGSRVVDQAQIHRMARRGHVEERRKAVEELKNNFVHFDDKMSGWIDILSLTQDTDDTIRWEAISSIGSVFPYILNKSQGWHDLFELTHNKNFSVRFGAAVALGEAFAHISDKEQGWIDLHGLTLDIDYWVRMGAATSLGVAFSNIPDKSQGWLDLYRLTQDTYDTVQRKAVEAIGSAFPHIPVEVQGMCICLLYRFTQIEDINSKLFANYSLGRISIYKATEAYRKEGFEQELEKALRFFEKASKASTYSDPAKFCLPFYRSFYTLTFKKEEAEADVKKYLEEAKSAIEGSKSKEKLLEAVENLGYALKEAQKTHDFNDMKSDLKGYRRYCERACELLDIQLVEQLAIQPLIV